jgi:hypothetical protein
LAALRPSSEKNKKIRPPLPSQTAPLVLHMRLALAPGLLSASVRAAAGESAGWMLAVQARRRRFGGDGGGDGSGCRAQDPDRSRRSVPNRVNL